MSLNAEESRLLKSIPWRKGLKVKDQWGRWWMVKSLRYAPWLGIRVTLAYPRMHVFTNITDESLGIVEYRQ